MFDTRNQFKYECYTDDIHSVEDVLVHMNILDKELKNTNLSSLRSFNTTYYIITKNVFSKLNTGYFKHDKLMREFDVVFAKYYFRALKAYISGMPCPDAWKECFQACEKNDSWQFVYMALGVNAHVNNDLAFALYDCIKIHKFKSDYDKVNDVISDSVKEVIEHLHEYSHLADGLEKKLQIIYSIFLNVIIRNWRKDAWNNYINLQYGYIRAKYINQNALNMLKKISSVTYFKEIFSKTFSKLSNISPKFPA